MDKPSESVYLGLAGCLQPWANAWWMVLMDGLSPLFLAESVNEQPLGEGAFRAVTHARCQACQCQSVEHLGRQEGVGAGFLAAVPASRTFAFFSFFQGRNNPHVPAGAGVVSDWALEPSLGSVVKTQTGLPCDPVSNGRTRNWLLLS